MTEQTVLITGATGHVGFGVLVSALRRGYKVHVVVRSPSKITAILNARPIKALINPAISFVTIPDMTAEGAFDEALGGVDGLIHVASPVGTATAGHGPEKLNALVVQPAVQMTMNILRAAARFPNVKRVVITGSIVSLLGATLRAPGVAITPEDRVEVLPEPYNNGFEAYTASKVASYKAAYTFMEAEKRSFDVVYIFPTFVIGPNWLANSVDEALNGSNTVLLSIPFGSKINTMAAALPPVPTGLIHLDDVSEMHVRALDQDIEGNQGFIANSAAPEWNDLRGIVAKLFPEETKDGRLPNDGERESISLIYNASKTEQVMGIKFKTTEEATKDVVQWMLDLQTQEAQETQSRL